MPRTCDNIKKDRLSIRPEKLTTRSNADKKYVASDLRKLRCVSKSRNTSKNIDKIVYGRV